MSVFDQIEQCYQQRRDEKAFFRYEGRLERREFTATHTWGE